MLIIWVQLLQDTSDLLAQVITDCPFQVLASPCQHFIFPFWFDYFTNRMKEEYPGDDEKLNFKMKILLNLGFKCSTVEFNIYCDTFVSENRFFWKKTGVGEKQIII